MNLLSLPRTLRTARHLRPSQIAWRLRCKFRRSRPPHLRAHPGSIETRGEFPSVPYVAHGGHCTHSLLDGLERGELQILHRQVQLGRECIDWQLGERTFDRLRTVTLHYHEWVWQLAKIVAVGGRDAGRASLLLRHYLGSWIRDCDLSVHGTRDLAWNSYAIATRLGFWCRLYTLLGPSGREGWGALEAQFLASMWRQADYLHDNLEYDLRGNHLLRDAVGLAFVGRFLAGARAAQWLRDGTALALEQAREQVLNDGGHFERSPMYHLQAMGDIVALCSLVEDAGVREELRQTWSQMARFQSWVCHPDGGIPLLNDSALNGACEVADMLRVGAQSLDLGTPLTPCPPGARHLEDQGLAVWHGDPWSVFFDVGAIGPDYQPGHAHADTLTCSTSFAGRRLFVDPGTFDYELDEMRDYDRCTAAHNTVCIGGENSSETWSVFRVGRRARATDVRFAADADGMTVTAGHDGYAWLPGAPQHTRRVQVGTGADGALRVTDRITSNVEHEVRCGFLLHPDWRVTARDDCGWMLRNDAVSRQLRVTVVGPPSIDLHVATRAYHPEFGKQIDTVRLCWSARTSTELEVTVIVIPS